MERNLGWRAMFLLEPLKQGLANVVVGLDVVKYLVHT